MPKCSGDGELIQGSFCPTCGSQLEYNGNYWCSMPACSYIMPAEGMRKKDKGAFNLAYSLLMKQRGEEPNPNSLYFDRNNTLIQPT